MWLSEQDTPEPGLGKQHKTGQELLAGKGKAGQGRKKRRWRRSRLSVYILLTKCSIKKRKHVSI